MGDAPPERQTALVEMDDETLVATARLTASTILVYPVGQVGAGAMAELLNELADRIEEAR